MHLNGPKGLNGLRVLEAKIPRARHCVSLRGGTCAQRDGFGFPGLPFFSDRALRRCSLACFAQPDIMYAWNCYTWAGTLKTLHTLNAFIIWIQQVPLPPLWQKGNPICFFLDFCFALNFPIIYLLFALHLKRLLKAVHTPLTLPLNCL